MGRAPATTVFRKILVPHDFSEHANRALALAAVLAREHRGKLIVLHVIPPYFPVSDVPMIYVPEVDVPFARRRLEAMVARILGKRRTPRPQCRVVLGDPLQRILGAAGEVDSIVIATRGRTGLAHLLIGSLAEKVVRHAPVPVLTVRPAATRRKVRGKAAPRSRRR